MWPTQTTRRSCYIKCKSLRDPGIPISNRNPIPKTILIGFQTNLLLYILLFDCKRFQSDHQGVRCKTFGIIILIMPFTCTCAIFWPKAHDLMRARCVLGGWGNIYSIIYPDITVRRGSLKRKDMARLVPDSLWQVFMLGPWKQAVAAAPDSVGDSNFQFIYNDVVIPDFQGYQKNLALVSLIEEDLALFSYPGMTSTAFWPLAIAMIMAEEITMTLSFQRTPRHFKTPKLWCQGSFAMVFYCFVAVCHWWWKFD